METKGNNIDNLFKEVLLEHEVSPPEEVWTNISELIKKKKSKKLIVLWYRIAAGVTILIASTWFITKNINKEINTQPLTENNQLIKDEKNNQNATRESIQPQPLLSSQQYNNNTIEQNGENTNSSDSKNSNAKNDKALLASKEKKSSNKRGIFRIKNEKEQFGIANKKDNTPQDTDNSIEELAMLNISLEIEIPKEQLDYDWTEINIINTKTNKENQWEVGGYYAPLYSYRALEMGSTDFDANSMMSNSEQGQYTYSGGFSVNYKITQRLSVGTGLSVVNHSYKVSNVVSLTSYNLAYFAETRSGAVSNQSYSVNNSIGQITSSGNVKSYSSSNLDNSNWVKDDIQAINNSYALPDNQTINQSFDYMEIPLFLRFKVIDKNIGIHLVSGVSSYFLVNNKVTIKSPDQPDIAGKTLNIKTTNLSGSLGMGLNYRLAQNLKLNLEPIFKIFLNSINTSNSTNVYPYSFGIYSGISYSF